MHFQAVIFIINCFAFLILKDLKMQNLNSLQFNKNSFSAKLQVFFFLIVELIHNETIEKRYNIVQEVVIKTIPKKKKYKKVKQLSEEALQTEEKRRKVKGKGGKERYLHLNAEFQRIAGEKRKPSSVINTNKQRKTIEWERLEISSR